MSQRSRLKSYLTPVRSVVDTTPGWLRIALVAVCAFLALAGWAVSSPMGSSPDDDYHLASIWCAAGENAGCSIDEHGDYWLAPELVHDSVCYVYQPEQSAQCQYRSGTDGIREPVRWDRGNYELGLYPPVFYATMRIFAGTDFVGSVWNMRIFNSALFVVLVTAGWIAVRNGVKRSLAWPVLVTAVPLALFIVPSTNPSSWAFTAAFVTFPAALAYFGAQGRARILPAILSGVGVLLAAGARADAAGFAVLAIFAAAALSDAPRSQLLRRAWLPAGAVALAGLVLATSQQSAALSGGLGVDQASPSAKDMIISMARNLPLMPDLVQGALGGWGLSWLDTRVPYGVSVIGLLILGAVLAAGLKGAPRRQLLTSAVIAGALVGYPLVLLARTNAVVGGYFQPRYLFPLLVLLVAVAVVPHARRRLVASPGQALLLWLALSFTALVSHYAVIRRFVTGEDAHWVSLNAYVEWWDFGLSPNVVWVATSVLTSAAFAGLILAITRLGDAEMVPSEPGVPVRADEPN